MPASKNMIWHSLETRKAGLIAFDLFPHLPVLIPTQLSFCGETFLDRIRWTNVTLPKKDLLIGIREDFPQAVDPFTLASPVPLPFM